MLTLLLIIFWVPVLMLITLAVYTVINTPAALYSIVVDQINYIKTRWNSNE